MGRRKRDDFDAPIPPDAFDEATEELDLSPRREDKNEGIDWPTITEASAQIGIPLSTLRRWAANGRIQAVTVRGAYRINPSEAVRLASSEERQEKIVNNGERMTQPAPDAPSPEALATTPPASMAAPAAPAPIQYNVPAQVLGMMNAVAELMTTINARVSSGDRHVEELLRLQLTAQPKMIAGFQAQIEGLLNYNTSLQAQNDKLRADLAAWYESQRTDRIREKELEIKKAGIEEGANLVKMLAPTLIGFIATKLDPSDPSKADTAIAAVLTGITEEQARKLASEGLITTQQGFQALGFRQNPPQRGQLTAWMQSFSGDAVARIVASGVLPKDQTLAFVAAHELASKITLSAPPPPAAPVVTHATTPEGGRVLDAEQTNTFKEFVGAVFLSEDVKTDQKDDRGEPLTLLEVIGSKMSPRARAGLKTLI